MATSLRQGSMESILNVDDYGPGRYARTRVLQQAGYTVQEASTGKEALASAAANNPSLILLDVNLPDMSGFEVCRRIRQDPGIVSPTILHISASNVQAHHQVAGLEGGADSYLVEPIEPAVLVATVKAFFRARQAEEALRRSNEELERFGYRVAHDLSEPLRTIVSQIQLLEQELGENPGERVSNSLHFIVDAGHRMHSFIDSLLGYSQATHVTAQPIAIKCRAMLAEAMVSLASAIEESQAQITHDLPAEATADAGFEQVFQNLISNAIKYRRDGVKPEIHVSAEAEGDSWTFSVRDNGIGIDPRYREGLFQIFHRLHGSDIPGNGIGLAICKKIVEAHAGSIWVESTPGVGSIFYFRIPRISGTMLSGHAIKA